MMLWVLSGVLAVSSAGMLVALAGAARQRRRFRLACSLSGLLPLDSTRASAGGAYPVTVCLRSSAGRGLSTEIEMTGLPMSVGLLKEGIPAGRRPVQQHFSPDIEVGDPAFDACFRVTGDERVALAALDEETRERALDLCVHVDFTVIDGVLRARLPRPILDDGSMRELVDELRALADGLTAGATCTHERLVRNAFADPTPGVRLRNLDVLLGTSEPEVVDRVRSEALAAPYPALRVRAAGDAGAAGRPALLSLVSNHRARAGVRREALAQLARSASAAVLTPVVRVLLADRHPDLVELAANAARERELVGALAPLRARALACKTVKTPRAKRMVVALAEALGALGPVGDRETEEALLSLLQVADPMVRLSVIEALGWAGSATAVTALGRCQESRKIQRASRAAIRAIQSRVEGVPEGAFSLVGVEGEGHLSLAVTPGAITISP